jgi:uncharacterized membrane protein
MSWARSIRHLSTGQVAMRRAFPVAALDAVEAAVRESERRHRGEIRFAVEGALGLRALMNGQTPRQRALEIFGRLGVWDTRERNGILIYVLLADRDVEIVADRGISALVDGAEWESICHTMESSFRRGDFGSGAVAGVQAAGVLLARHFPAADETPNELPDRPTIV